MRGLLVEVVMGSGVTIDIAVLGKMVRWWQKVHLRGSQRERKELK